MDTSILKFVSANGLQLFSDHKIILSLVMGLGLSACCGFRVFVPLLAASIATKMGVLHLGDGFQWMSSTTAIVCFGAATIFEIAGYYIPFVDNILKWGLGIIVGGGSAGIIQAGTALTRATSTATTAGVANPVVATIEHILAIAGSIFSIVIPFIIAGIVCVLILLALFFVIRYFKKHIPTTEVIPILQE